MSMAELDMSQTELTPLVASTHGSNPDRPLHRIRKVRHQQGVSVRCAARQMSTDVRQVREQEDPATDLNLSTLYAWQRALDVPVADLLVDLDAPLSAPVLKRAQMLRIMKTAMSIMEKAQHIQVRRMAQMMVEQLIQIMPELEGVSPWHEVGQRRTADDLGIVVQRRLSDDLLSDYH